MLDPPVELGAKNVAVAWALAPVTLVKDGAPGATKLLLLLLLLLPPQEANWIRKIGKKINLTYLFKSLNFIKVMVVVGKNWN